MPIPRESSFIFVFEFMPNRAIRPPNSESSHCENAGLRHVTTWLTRSSEGNGHASSTTPIRERTARWTRSEASAPNGSPNSLTSPAPMCCKPKATRIIVVLPAPFAPTKPTISPGATARLTSRSANESLKSQLTCRMSKRFVMKPPLSSVARIPHLRSNRASHAVLHAKLPGQRPEQQPSPAFPRCGAVALPQHLMVTEATKQPLPCTVSMNPSASKSE